MVVVVVSAVAGGRSYDFSCQKKLFIRETEFFSGGGCGSGGGRGSGGDGGGAL